MVQNYLILLLLTISFNSHGAFQDIESLRSLGDSLKSGKKAVSIECENTYGKFEMDIFRESLEKIGDAFDETFEVFSTYKVKNKLTGRIDTGIGAGEISHENERIYHISFSTKNNTGSADIVTLNTSRWFRLNKNIDSNFWFFISASTRGNGQSTGGFPPGVNSGRLLYRIENCKQKIKSNPHTKN